MNIHYHSAEFVMGAAALEQLPDAVLPEIAFAGRSNVGKSSLINALTGRRSLARTSVTPGRTQQLNFFDVNQIFMLVDMPGYGYAKASKKDIQSWNALVRDYLRGRANLKRVYLLIDARRRMMDIDHEIMKLLDDSAVSYQIVLTKADKLKAPELDAVIASVQTGMKKHVACHPDILTTSAHKQQGIEELQIALNALVG